MVGKVQDACPDAQWRLMVVLSRFGGSRCLSEILPLLLDSADWDAGRIRVDSPKTEHHAGKESCVIPMFFDLRPHFEKRWHQAEPGQTRFISRFRPGQTFNAQFGQIVKRANLTPWPKLWHNMRASRQTELGEVFPSHVVCASMGNSQQVARRHYLQVTDDHFRKTTGGQCGKIVASHAWQGVANEKSDASETEKTSNVSQGVAQQSVSKRPAFGWITVHVISVGRFGNGQRRPDSLPFQRFATPRDERSCRLHPA